MIYFRFLNLPEACIIIFLLQGPCQKNFTAPVKDFIGWGVISFRESSSDCITTNHIFFLHVLKNARFLSLRIEI